VRWRRCQSIQTRIEGVTFWAIIDEAKACQILAPNVLIIDARREKPVAVIPL
jgi:hypothetical protein